MNCGHREQTTEVAWVRKDEALPGVMAVGVET